MRSGIFPITLPLLLMGKQVFLFRHGQPDDGGQDVCKGCHLNTQLSLEGVNQTERNIQYLAARFGAELQDALVVTSPLDRAAYIGQRCAKLHGVTHKIDPLLTDIDVGIWEGMKWEDIEREWKEQFDLCWEDALSLNIPGAEESVTMFQERILQRWRYWTHESAASIIILGLHKAPNKVILDAVAERKLTFKGQSMGCINEIHFNRKGPVILQEDKIVYANLAEFVFQPT